MIARGHDRQRGFALLYVMAFMLLVGGALTMAASYTTPLRQEAVRTRDADQAFALAESGVLLARKRIEVDPAFRGSQEARFAGGLIAYEVQKGPKGFVVVAQGTVRTQFRGQAIALRRRIEVVLERAPPGRTVVVAWRER